MLVILTTLLCIEEYNLLRKLYKLLSINYYSVDVLNYFKYSIYTYEI